MKSTKVIVIIVVMSNTVLSKILASTWTIVDPEDSDLRRNVSFESRFLSTEIPTPEEPDPCERELPRQPEFYMPGRRISEAKCYEYIWQMKHRADTRQKEKDCTRYRSQKGLGPLYGPGVIGGREAAPSEFPHMGALGWRTVDGKWKFQCGCSLISVKFLLTAGHCSSAPPRDSTLANIKPEVVRIGNVNSEELSDQASPFDMKIERIVVHPDYAPPKKYNDIALVQLTRGILFSKYTQPACLWTQFDSSPLGNRAYVTGWGYVDLDLRQAATKLQVAGVDIINSEQCNEMLRFAWNRHFHGIQPHQLCAGELSGGVDTCQGDSGGPLQVPINLPIDTEGSMNYIIGVTSFGFGCAHANTPAVYTRVASFIDWIEDVVWRGH